MCAGTRSSQLARFRSRYLATEEVCATRPRDAFGYKRTGQDPAAPRPHSTPCPQRRACHDFALCLAPISRGAWAERAHARDDGCMSRGDDVPPDDVEFLDIGPERGVRAAFRLRRWPKLLLFLVAAVAVAVAVIAVVRSGGSPTTPPRAAGSRSSAPRLSSAAIPGVVSTPGVSVTTLGQPLLGVHARWELFGRGSGVVVRIQFTLGRITR